MKVVKEDIDNSAVVAAVMQKLDDLEATFIRHVNAEEPLLLEMRDNITKLLTSYGEHVKDDEKQFADVNKRWDRMMAGIIAIIVGIMGLVASNVLHLTK